jgi:hypothetical protein
MQVEQTEFQDPEYQRLRASVKSKATTAQVLGVVTSALLAATFASFAFINAPILGIAAGIGAAVIGYASFRKQMDANLDQGEMEARRNAVNLGRVFGERGRDMAPILASSGRSDGRSWADSVEKDRTTGRSNGI